MRRCLLVAVWFGLALLFVRPSMPQAASDADRDSPASLQAAYDRAKESKDWASALAAAQKLVGLRPSAENLRMLAEAQIFSGANADALATTERALEAVEKEKPADGQPDTAWKDLKSKILLTRGNAFLRLRRNADAIEAYNQAAALASNPGLSYFNICATTYNVGDMQASVAACRKAVQADPTRANAWFVLGSVLFATSTIDDKANVVITDETRQALNKYLELAPDGPHAEDVKAMLKMSK